MPELTAADLAEIEELAERDAGEHCRGPLLALVAEVRRLRSVILGSGLHVEPLRRYGGGVIGP